MPPRFAFWTILIDNAPTAFRAREREELLPTLYQLQRRNPTAVMKWFAHGKLWDTPEQAQWARQNAARPRAAKKTSDWRPGGAHKDPRARFKQGKRRDKGVQGKPRGERGPRRERSERGRDRTKKG